MGKHFISVCKYGYKHSQCRCTSPNKEVIQVNCDNPKHKENPLNQFVAPAAKTDLKGVSNLNELRDYIHETAVEKGWWETERELGTILMLCVSELSEALEEYRKGYAPDHVYYSEGAKPEGVPIELADTIIRILDYCGHAGIDIQSILYEKLVYNNTRSYRHGGKVV